MANYAQAVNDNDRPSWYKGGFRCVVLPRNYIVDKSARDQQVNDLRERWDALGFFSSDSKMTTFHLKQQQEDPYFKSVGDSFYGNSNIKGEKALMEFADIWSDPNDPQISRAFFNLFYKQDKDGTTTLALDSTNEKVNQTDTAGVPETRGTDVLGKDLMAQSVSDTSLGGNDALNCYWSYNEDDDIVHPQTAYNRHIADGKGVNLEGMGRVYAENIDRYQQIFYMNMGVPVYKGGIISLFGGSSSAEARLINRGNTMGATIGNLTGILFTIIFAIPLLPLYGISLLTSLFNDYPVSKYFEHRSTMPMYFKFCNMLIGHMAVNLGLYRATEDILQLMGAVVDFKKTTNTNIANAPSIFKTRNVGIPEVLQRGPDILAIMYKRNLRLREFDKSIRDKLPDDRFKSTDQYFAEWIKNTSVSGDFQDMQSQILIKTQEKDLASKSGNLERVKVIESEIASLNSQLDALKEAQPSSFLGKLANWTGSALKDCFGMMYGTGLQTIDFIGLRVEKVGAITESFSNTTGPSEIAEQINGMAAQGMAKQSSFLGNIIHGRSGVTLIDSASDIIGGIMNSLGDMIHVGQVINVVTGNGYADIPEKWQNSSCTRSFVIELQLRARYGDPVSWLQSVGIPLACILAAFLPRGIGGSMYTSPFLIRGYCKGQFSLPSGIGESLTVTRGATEFGYNINHLPMAIDVSMTVKDLSPILYVGMDNDMNSSMDEYMSTLTGLGLFERTYLIPKIMRRLNRAILLKRNTIVNPLWWGNNIGSWGVVRTFANITSPYARPTPNS